MKSLFFSLFFFLSLLFIVSYVNAANITCNTVESEAVPCVPFAIGTDAMPSAACCSGLQQLAQSAQSVDEKKAACKCLKDGIKNYKGVQDKFLRKLPDQCKIKVDFPISITINCDMIH